jgi:hypothetical protein
LAAFVSLEISPWGDTMKRRSAEEEWREWRYSIRAIDYRDGGGGRQVWMNHKSEGCNKHRSLNLWHPTENKGHQRYLKRKPQ